MIPTSPFLLCLFFMDTVVHRNHMCSICTGDGTACFMTRAEERCCLSGTAYTWSRTLTQGINGVSSKEETSPQLASRPGQIGSGAVTCPDNAVPLFFSPNMCHPLSCPSCPFTAAQSHLIYVCNTVN